MPTIIPSLPPFPTYQDIETFIYDVTSYVPGIPSDVASAARGLYNDLVRFGPPEFPEMPDLRKVTQEMPEMGRRLFVVSVPAVVEISPPPPKTPAQKVMDHISSHPYLASVFAASILGGTGYAAYNYKTSYDRLSALKKRAREKRKSKHVDAHEEREIIIVLGADSTPYGATLIRQLVQKNYIVLASVLSGASSDALEADPQTTGWVRALVLDPEEPSSIPHFLRSLSSTLSMRFPTNIHGDPYASMTSSVGGMSGSSSSTANLSRVTSVISLLSLGQADLLPFTSFASPLSFEESYAHAMTTRSLSPLYIIHSLLPLFRSRKTLGSPSASMSMSSSGAWFGFGCGGSGHAKKNASVIMCVPASARVGVLGSSATSMSIHSVVQGFKILKREAMLDPTLEGTNVRFVLLDVGDFSTLAGSSSDKDKAKLKGRTPSDVSLLTSTLTSIISPSYLFGFIPLPSSRFSTGYGLRWNPWLGWSLNLGFRRSVGAGATTYALASHLPTPILDFLLVLPHRLAILRERLVTQPPRPSSSSSRPQSQSQPKSPNGVSQTGNKSTTLPPSASAISSSQNPTPSEHMSEAEADAESSAYTSEVDSQSGAGSQSRRDVSAGPGPGSVADSWISVRDEE